MITPSTVDDMLSSPRQRQRSTIDFPLVPLLSLPRWHGLPGRKFNTVDGEEKIRN
jgi:hypothetical protein